MSHSNFLTNISSPKSNKSWSYLMISYGSTDKGLVSQQLINIPFGISLIAGVLLNGLVLKEFHKPVSCNRLIKFSWSLNSMNSSSLSKSISIEINFLLSPLFYSFD